MAFDEKIEHYALQRHIVPSHDIIKTPEQLAGIRESSRLNIAILDEIERQIHIGMSTEEIDRIVVDMTKQMGRNRGQHSVTKGLRRASARLSTRWSATESRQRT